MGNYRQQKWRDLQFIGEDRIRHTPKDETVRLKVGEAFDITAEKTQTDFKRITSKLYESEWEIVLRNHRKEDATVSLLEPMTQNQEILSSNHSFKKVDAFTIRFDVKVPKDKEIKLHYRVRSGL